MSYSYIAEQLHISKSTCTKWEQNLFAEIDELKRAKLEELYESYSMTKQARIKKLGDTLKKINEALANADFSTIDPAKLLDFKLKYTEALKGEYVKQKPNLKSKKLRANSIISAFIDLLNRTQAGDITAGQAQRESFILSNLLKAYDIVEVKDKLEKLEETISNNN